MPGIVVKPRSRIYHGHDWVYASEVKKTFGNPEPGSVISIKDFKDRPLGSAIYNPQSQIIARRFSRRTQPLDIDFFKRRLQRALELRERLPGIDPNLCRLVWSESDGLPGVVLDRYGPHCVLQTLTLAMDQRIDMIRDALIDTLKPETIVARNDATIRVAEGMETRVEVLHGDPPPPFCVAVNGIEWEIDLLHGQKTGLYLDQLENYRRVGELARERRVYDGFTNQGGFALACAQAGAASVLGIDSSESAIAAASANAARAELDQQAKFLEANAFDDLKARESAGERFDLIILDPPSFTKNKRGLQGAMRGYKEIHLRALKMLDPGGILVTYSCSHHVTRREFLEMIRAASVDAKRTLRQIGTHSQRADHPVIATLPETEYLKGFVYEVMPSW